MELLISAADHAWLQQCRKQDLRHREIEIAWRTIDDARRLVDKKTQQLEAVLTLSALIAGFSMVVLVESQFDQGITNWLLGPFAFSTAAVVRIPWIQLCDLVIYDIATDLSDDVCCID